MSGEASIFTYPFRMYVREEIEEFEGRHSDGRHVVRMYKPWAARKAGMPLSPDVPFSDWPRFAWHPKLNVDKRLKPPSEFFARPTTAQFVDALRVDVRGPDAGKLVLSFTDQFVRWLRHLSLQPWIGEYEPQSDAVRKYGFRCDSGGRAIDTPFAYAKVMTFAGWIRVIDNPLWQEAIRRTLQVEEPEAYWDLFLDSQIQRSVNKLAASLLSLALALEIARDRNFQRFAPTKVKRGIGTVLDQPFDDTNLLKHLSARLESVNSRTLEKEHPDHWEDVTKLYRARHKIAHGGPPVIIDKSGVRPATDEDAKQLSDAVFHVLCWIEAL